jgi:hypothetical protein
MHSERDDLLVMRAIEDADACPLWESLRDPPEKVVVELLGRRLLERDDLETLRIDTSHDVLDRAVLAGRVHRLEDDEDGVRVSSPEKLLCLRELLDSASQYGLRFGYQLLA